MQSIRRTLVMGLLLGSLVIAVSLGSMAAGETKLFRMAPLGATLEEVEGYYGPYVAVRGMVGNLWNRDQWATAQQFDAARRYYFTVFSNGMEMEVQVAFHPDSSQSRLHPTMRMSYQLFTFDKPVKFTALGKYLPGLADLLTAKDGVPIAEQKGSLPSLTIENTGRDPARSFVYLNFDQSTVVAPSMKTPDGKNAFYDLPSKSKWNTADSQVIAVSVGAMDSAAVELAGRSRLVPDTYFGEITRAIQAMASNS